MEQFIGQKISNVQNLGLNFGPCRNVGLCDRSKCPFQHVDPPPNNEEQNQRNNNEEQTQPKETEIADELLADISAEITISEDLLENVEQNGLQKTTPTGVVNNEHETTGTKHGNEKNGHVMTPTEPSEDQNRKCVACSTVLDEDKTSLECHHCADVYCLACTGMNDDSQPAKVINSNLIKGITWICDECFDEARKSKDKIKSTEEALISQDQQIKQLKEKAKEQEQLIQQLLEDQKNKPADVGNHDLQLKEKAEEQEQRITQLLEDQQKKSDELENQEQQWQSQLDRHIKKANETATEMHVMATSIEERNLEVAAANKTISELKADRATKTKQIKQLQEHLAKYKKMYEDEYQERNDLKRTTNNLNALVERFLISPTQSQAAIAPAPEPAVEHHEDNPIKTKADEKPAEAINNVHTDIPSATVENSVRKKDDAAAKKDPTGGINSKTKPEEHPETTEMQEKAAAKAAHPTLRFDPQRTVWGDDIMEVSCNKSHQQKGEPQLWQQMRQRTEPEHQQAKMMKIYVGNIPHNMKEDNLLKIFGHYIATVDDITITREVSKRGQERSLYAMMNIKESDKEEILNFNGLNVSGKQIVVEESKRQRRNRDEEWDSDEEEERTKPQCKFYLEGRCKKGSECDFEHRRPCTFYEKNGRCKFGDECRFAHINRKGTGTSNDDFLSAFIKALAPQLSKNFGQNR